MVVEKTDYGADHDSAPFGRRRIHPYRRENCTGCFHSGPPALPATLPNLSS
jgi:hypothetical protein